MTLAYWCVLISMFMPIVWVGFAKVGGGSTGGGRYDNAAPRAYLGRLEGWPARANWAQQNALEAFPPFAAGVIIAHQVGQLAQGTIDLLAVTFVVARIIYGVLYMLDMATLRSLVWFVGLISTVLLFVLSA
ncbi:MAG: MAPEG family protein [Gammaproteobacteria bacterium]|nr:MAPEG family protein [Gammaproteobacteria bacterium]